MRGNPLGSGPHSDDAMKVDLLAAIIVPDLWPYLNKGREETPTLRPGEVGWGRGGAGGVTVYGRRVVVTVVGQSRYSQANLELSGFLTGQRAKCGQG